MSKPIFTGREDARGYCVRTIAANRRALENPNDFASFPRSLVIAHCENVLRWIDCAPDGANFILAPMQDKTGTPCGTAFSENIGPGQMLRNARAKRGLDPITGPDWVTKRGA